MEGFGPEVWGDRVADVYEQWLDATPHETTMAVEVLAELAGDGPALELAIGNGRVALPLAAKGVAVHGIDASPAMLERLREQPGGAEIPAIVGNFADVSVDGEFRLVYVVFQTFHVLGSLAEQVRCFQNVAAHLVDGGYFVLETNYSPPDLGTPDGSMTVWNLEPDRVMLSFERRGDELQAVTDIETWLTEDSIRLIPMRYRYASPVELDLMARLAGLELRHRWGGWDRTDPGPDSKAFVSVYVKERGAASYPTRSAAGRSDAEGGAWPLPKADQEASAEKLVAELANGEPVLQLAQGTQDGAWKVVFTLDAFEGVDAPEDQLAVFERAAGLLSANGLFVLQAAVPQPWRFVNGTRIVVAAADADRVVLEISRLDRRLQKVVRQEVELSEQGVRLRPTSFRYAWPAELDLMARVTGLRLVDRWAGWGRQPLKPDSPSHVSVYAPGPGDS